MCACTASSARRTSGDAALASARPAQRARQGRERGGRGCPCIPVCLNILSLIPAKTPAKLCERSTDRPPLPTASTPSNSTEHRTFPAISSKHCRQGLGGHSAEKYYRAPVSTHYARGRPHQRMPQCSRQPRRTRPRPRFPRRPRLRRSAAAQTATQAPAPAPRPRRPRRRGSAARRTGGRR